MKRWILILLFGAVMTTYNTGNAVGSTDARDLSDNAQNLDLLSVGKEMQYLDRLGVPRKSWAGLEQQVADWLAGQGWEAVTIPYAANAVVQRPTQLVERAGELYRVRLQSDLPLTLTGTWTTDAPKLVAIGNQSLRDLLAGAAGADNVGYGAITVAAALENIRQSVPVSPHNFEAVGNGIVDDTSAFAALESAVTGRTVDLRGKQYLVTAVPNKNAYINGSFKVGSYTREPKPSVFTLAPRFHAFGGQLRKLKDALTDPLYQYVGIVFIGDSITWGTGTGEQAPSDPRDGTLSDPRDVFATPSYVNEFKRYIGESYAGGSTPVLSNWPASPSGESIATYSTERALYPVGGPFTVTTSGTSQTVSDSSSPSSPLRFQRIYADGDLAGASYTSIKFKMTGDSFTLSFASVEVDATFYELYIDGVLIGTYDTAPGTDGIVAGVNQRRTHGFSFIRNKDVEIRTKRGGRSNARRLRLEAVIVNKKIVISNQGINGSDAIRYKLYNLAGNTMGDGVAVGATDSFVIVQLGTNDRLFETTRPKSETTFAQALGDMLAAIPGVDFILMVANPVSVAADTDRAFKMQQARNAIYRHAKSSSIDMIDNYTALLPLAVSVYAPDGTHPNRLGMSLIAKNIIGALESE